jgi:hypothetical protein
LKKLNTKSEGFDINEFKETMGGSKRFRALLADIYESEKIITIQRGAGIDTTKFLITQTGKKRISEHIS